jgi:hypothetical protein
LPVAQVRPLPDRAIAILNEHSAMFGTLLHGMAEIKNLLKPGDDPGRGG